MSDSRNRKSKRPPLILISPSVETKGHEFGDTSISLSETYQQAVLTAGGVPLALPCLPGRELIKECVARCDGILFTGGDDVDPRLYAKRLPRKLARTVTVADGGRDLRELILVDEAFRQRKPVFGICRGIQIINVALGGTLVVDIRHEIPGALRHQQMAKKSQIVHQARLTGDSMLARITRKQNLGVNSTHHQAVGRVAEPLRVTAQSDDGVVEALELKADAAHLLPYFMTVQFHPERLAPRYPEHQALFDSFVRACMINRNSTL